MLLSTFHYIQHNFFLLKYIFCNNFHRNSIIIGQQNQQKRKIDIAFLLLSSSHSLMMALDCLIHDFFPLFSLTLTHYFILDYEITQKFREIFFYILHFDENPTIILQLDLTYDSLKVLPHLLMYSSGPETSLFRY